MPQVARTQQRPADPTANARYATRWDPGTRTIVTVAAAGETPTWQQLGLQVPGHDRRVVPGVDRPRHPGRGHPGRG